ncbi:hypothetical protein SFC66_11375 [Terribacillus saccharophilus]|uniref:PdaC/SigV domain-containing protein n=1 Tax=Terribacillus saccharophilus TaxID=361277 RepID=UPI0039829E90
MKFLKVIMTIGLILVLMIMAGCSTSNTTNAISEVKDESEEEKGQKQETEQKMLAKKLSDYETIELKDKTEQSDLHVNYPNFNYEPLDKLIEPKTTDLFEHHMKEKDDEAYYSDAIQVIYTYTSEFDEPIITDDFVSILFNDYIYAGGAHGSPGTSSIYFDLKDNRELTIDEVLEKNEVSLEALADLTAENIITDERYRDYRGDPASDQFKMDVIATITPESNNFSTFKVTEESITIYNTYYGFLPMAAGVVDTEISWKDLQERTKKLEQSSTAEGDSIQYKNKDFGFDLTLPSSWRDKFTVEKDSAFSPLVETSYNFNFMVDGEEICNIFTIYVYDEEDYHDGPLERYITTKDGKVFTYGTIMELPIEFSTDPLLDNETDVFTNMVNEEVPELIESFTF